MLKPDSLPERDTSSTSCSKEKKEKKKMEGGGGGRGSEFYNLKKCGLCFFSNFHQIKLDNICFLKLIPICQTSVPADRHVCG